MVNTVTQKTLYGSAKSKKVIRQVHIVSDGSEESDLIVYDNSAFINDVSKGAVMEIAASGSSCVCRLEWDQTTDVPIASFDPAYTQKICFKYFGGFHNPNGTGATGDILLTTANLDSGDEVTLIITVKQ